jgi:hypothetical protein
MAMAVTRINPISRKSIPTSVRQEGRSRVRNMGMIVVVGIETLLFQRDEEKDANDDDNDDNHDEDEDEGDTVDHDDQSIYRDKLK